jgi:hypothetical protein
MIKIQVLGLRTAHGMRRLRGDEMMDVATRARRILKINYYKGKVQASGQTIKVTGVYAPAFGKKNPLDKFARRELADAYTGYFKAQTPNLEVNVRVD